MGMNVRINMKGASKIVTQIDYQYDIKSGEHIRIGDFLDQTVEITIARFKDKEKDLDDASLKLLSVLSSKEIEEKADTGKVSFGIRYNTNEISIEDAKANARQCFVDGLVALFINGERYESLEDKVTIIDGAEVTFVKMVFLAGRMW